MNGEFYSKPLRMYIGMKIIAWSRHSSVCESHIVFFLLETDLTFLPFLYSSPLYLQKDILYDTWLSFRISQRFPVECIYIFFFYLLMQQNNIFYAQLHVCYEYPRWVMVRGHKRLQNTREKGREGQLKLKTVFKLFMRYKQAQSDWVYSFFIFIFLAQCRRPSCHYFCSVAPAFTYSDINQR